MAARNGKPGGGGCLVVLWAVLLCAAVLYLLWAFGLVTIKLPFRLPELPGLSGLPDLPSLIAPKDDSSSAAAVDPQTDSALHEQLETHYYVYDQLSADEQERYRIVLDAFQSREPREYPFEDIDELSRIRDFVTADHPEFFDLVSVNAETVTTSGLFFEDKTTTIQAVYDCDAETSQLRRQQLEDAVTRCLAGMPAGLDDYSKAKYLYEYIALNVSYDWGAARALADGSEQHLGQTAYDALVGGQSVCGGYARAFQYLAQRVGLECIYATGESRGAAHAWNIVGLDGDYYHVDPTRGDPQFIADDGTSIEGEAVSYDYLCLPDQDIELTHAVNRSVPLPACTSLADNYFVREGADFVTPNVGQVGVLVEDALAQGRDSVQFRCFNQDAFDQLIYELFDNQMIYAYLPTSSCRYVVNDTLLTIPIML